MLLSFLAALGITATSASTKETALNIAAWIFWAVGAAFVGVYVCLKMFGFIQPGPGFVNNEIWFGRGNFDIEMLLAKS